MPIREENASQQESRASILIQSEPIMLQSPSAWLESFYGFRIFSLAITASRVPFSNVRHLFNTISPVTPRARGDYEIFAAANITKLRKEPATQC
jgi:hypothetical protein